MVSCASRLPVLYWGVNEGGLVDEEIGGKVDGVEEGVGRLVGFGG